ncbi:hypothetical protein QTP88_018855 [Uroleucon formosanum]
MVFSSCNVCRVELLFHLDLVSEFELYHCTYHQYGQRCGRCTHQVRHIHGGRGSFVLGMMDAVSEFEVESQSANSSDDSDVEILSDDSDESSTERPSPAVSVKAKEKNVSINTVLYLKPEKLPQNSTAVKKDKCKIRIKLLREKLIKEPDIETDVSVLKTDNEAKNTQVPQPQNGIEKNEIKEQVKE